MKRLLRRVLVPAVWIASFACVAQAGPTEVVVPVTPDSQCFPGGINDVGQVVVWCSSPNRAFVWSFSDHSSIEITQPGMAQIGATAINNLGQVGGVACDAVSCQAFIWTQDQGMSVIGPGQVEHINDLGDTLLRVQQGTAWEFRRADGVVAPLPVGWTPATVQALNNLAQVALTGGDPSVPKFAIWSLAQGLVELPAPPLLPPPPGIKTGSRHANAINDAGKLVGDVNGRGLVYTPGSDYALLQGATIALPYHINAVGTIAGESSPDGLQWRASVWTSSTSMTTLPSGEGRTYAWLINSAGQVIGVETLGSGGYRTVAWTVSIAPPTPAQQVQAVQSSIESFIEAGLVAEEDSKGLIAKLDGATTSIAKADTPAAKNLLQSLSNQVRALEKSGRVSPATASALQQAIAQALLGM